jgi:CDP-diacylglycerol--glycerol-3-phosphate 3-phosphatidyltransferase
MGMDYYDLLPARPARPSIIPDRARPTGTGLEFEPPMTFTRVIGTVCNFPLRAIIAACVALRISPNVLTFTGVVVNVTAAWLLGIGYFWSAGFVMLAANIFDYIDGKVARERDRETLFGAFWDSVMDRFSDITLFIGLIYLYAKADSVRYVIIASLAMMFSVMTSYTRARAESMIEKCKVGFMERPERIVLFMIGAFTNRMAAVLWVILILSIVTVADRIYFTWRELNGVKESKKPLVLHVLWRAFFWTDERASWPYDLWVIAILAFVWLTPPAWIRDPIASGRGMIGWILGW